MKTHEKHRRDEATHEENANAGSTQADSEVRGGARTAKVAVPETLNAATKVVAARRGRAGKKVSVQDLVAAALRADPDIAAEEAAQLREVRA